MKLELVQRVNGCVSIENFTLHLYIHKRAAMTGHNVLFEWYRERERESEDYRNSASITIMLKWRPKNCDNF